MNGGELLSIDNDTDGIQVICSMQNEDDIDTAVVDSEGDAFLVEKAVVDEAKVTSKDVEVNTTNNKIEDEEIVNQGNVVERNKDDVGESSGDAATEEEEYENMSWGGVPVDLESGIVVFVTSCPGNAKVKSDTRRVLHLLNVKKVEYKTVDLANNGALRIHMLERSDLNITIPQVHVNGVFIGTAEDLQESEDYGELDDLLSGVDPEIVKENTRLKIEERIREIEEKEYLIGSIRPEIIGHTCKEGENRGTGIDSGEVIENCGLEKDADPCQQGRVERKIANHHMYYIGEEQTDSIGSVVGTIKAKTE